MRAAMASRARPEKAATPCRNVVKPSRVAAQPFMRRNASPVRAAHRVTGSAAAPSARQTKAEANMMPAELNMLARRKAEYFESERRQPYRPLYLCKNIELSWSRRDDCIMLAARREYRATIFKLQASDEKGSMKKKIDAILL